MNVCISTSNMDNTVQTKGRWNFVRTVLGENVDLIFAPVITIVPQVFFLPFLILQSAMDCYGLDSDIIRYSYMLSAFALFLPQMFSFVLYVRFSSIYYEHFRKTTIGKKVIFLWNCCRRETNESSKSSQPCRYALSKTIKSDHELTM